MKKISLSLVTLVTLSTLIASFQAVQIVAADDVTGDVTGKVKLVENTTTTPPLDPEDPDNEPYEPEDGFPGTGGPLSIDFASNFHFGEHQISNRIQTVYAAPQALITPGGETRSNYVQVSDLRGTKEGWHLTVTATEFTEDTESFTLEGAQIGFTGGYIVGTGEESEKPTAVIDEATALVPGIATSIMNAEEGKGAASWLYVFGAPADKAQSVSLTIPVGSKIGEYTSTLTWTLVASPSNP